MKSLSYTLFCLFFLITFIPLFSVEEGEVSIVTEELEDDYVLIGPLKDPVLETIENMVNSLLKLTWKNEEKYQEEKAGMKEIFNSAKLFEHINTKPACGIRIGSYQEQEWFGIFFWNRLKGSLEMNLNFYLAPKEEQVEILGLLKGYKPEIATEKARQSMCKAILQKILEDEENGKIIAISKHMVNA